MTGIRRAVSVALVSFLTALGSLTWSASPAFAVGAPCDLSEVKNVPPGTMVPDGTVVSLENGHHALCSNGSWRFI